MLAGCATAGTMAFKEGSAECKKFKDLSDDEALKTVADLYNVVPETDKDGVAKNVALTEYFKELKARKSKYVDESGVYDLGYVEIDLRKWSDGEIVELYNYLESGIRKYESGKIEEMTGKDRSMMAIYMTARNAVYKEGKRRDLMSNITQIVGTVLVAALNVALAAI